ncbi:hypothetical protein Trydic_g5782 [Trypoxylus dichotomus]
MSGIASACDASMPRKAPRHCKRAAYWWTAEIAELRKRCLRLRRIAQRAGNQEEANIRSAEHREAKKSLRRAINESKARHWKDMVSDVDSEPWGARIQARHPSTWGDETAGYSGANQDAANCASAFPLSSCEDGQRFEDARRFPTI